MDYIIVSAPTYEEAVAKAKQEYGSRLRIHSRKNTVKTGLFGMGKTTICELTCFLTEEAEPKTDVETAPAVAPTPEISEEKEHEDEIRRFENEAKTPDPDMKKPVEYSNNASLKIFEQAKKNIEEELRKNSQSEVKPESPAEEVSEPVNTAVNESICKLLDRVRELLSVNDFTPTYTATVVESVEELLEKADPALPSDEELEIMVLDKIAELLLIDNSFNQNPDRIAVVLGPASCGKTTMIAKMAALFSSVNSSIRRNVRIVSLDDNPAVVSQLQKVGQALSVPVTVAPHETELADSLNAQMNNELIFVDSVGKPVQNTNPDYKVFGLMNVANRAETKYLLVLPAPMKNSDLKSVFDQYKNCRISGMIITKTDETTTIGNVISASSERNIPIVYISSGKKIPRDISKASSSALLRMLRGFSIDINKILDDEE